MLQQATPSWKDDKGTFFRAAWKDNLGAEIKRFAGKIILSDNSLVKSLLESFC